ncbi:thioesterase family protein [Novosphingobium resinovorum]|uniref:acyl-CoA thioesterase n=1 Tax=Novosphingobium resinovorum TaxID=158500 RepID=UPI002ED0103A|nr:thioesterase family protein [Novosphingobium resinovorum]
MNSAQTHDCPLTIEIDDIDFMGHVNNSTYLKWVQAAVIEHWQRVASPTAVAAYMWIALKHEITYRKPAFLHDELTANVVLEHVRRESAFYETTIRRGGETIAEVKSRWCCIDAVSRRPVRVTEPVMACFFPEAADRQFSPTSG